MKISPLFPIAALFCLLSCTGHKTEMDRYIDGVMSRLTIEQKIGQLNLQSAAGFRSAEKITTENDNIKALQAGMLGGMYGVSDIKLMRALQDMAMESPAGIPLIFGLDVIHGYQTVFPIPLALSTSWNPAMIEQTARIAASEATAEGINWVFSPMVDIARDPRWGRIAEGSGEDPYLGGEIAKAMVYGYQGRDNDLSKADNVMACVKHYALYGAAEAGRDYNTVNIDRQTALNGYLWPYHAAAEAGAGSYMSSFNEFEGVPASANSYLLDDLLRKSWGFDGFVVSDATAIMEMCAHGIGDLQEVSARALRAGLDMDMNSNGYVGTLMKSIEEGRISRADIDRACRRVLEAKYRLGLFDDPYRYLGGERAECVYSVENRAFARKAAQESQVLLKNDGVLPLRSNARVAVIGYFGNNASEMAGTWAMSSHQNECVTIYDAMKEVGGARVSYAQGSWLMNDEALEMNIQNGLMGMFVPNFKPKPTHTVSKQRLLSEALANASRADVIVACLGETSMMNGEGASRSDISIPDAQTELLRALKKTGKPIVLVLTTGRPLVLDWEDENMDAILCTWSLGSEAGHAIADVLYGKVNPSGKLTTTFPRSVGQIPLYYNHKNTGRPHGDHEKYVKFRSNYIDVVNAPLYPFGYGLSYSSFKYGAMRLSSAEMPLGGSVKVSVDVTNTGAMDGMETVQLYVRDVVGSTTRPVKELKGFRKVAVKSGETVAVDFELTSADFGFYNAALDFTTEPGEFHIMVGPDSEHLQTSTLVVK